MQQSACPVLPGSPKCGHPVYHPADFCRRFPEEAKRLAFCRLQPEPFYQRSYLCWKKERGKEAIIRDFAEVCLRKAKTKCTEE